MTRVGYSARTRRARWWVSAPWWAWLFLSPLLLGVALFGPLTAWALRLYALPLKLLWQAARAPFRRA